MRLLRNALGETGGVGIGDAGICGGTDAGSDGNIGGAGIGGGKDAGGGVGGVSGLALFCRPFPDGRLGLRSCLAPGCGEGGQKWGVHLFRGVTNTIFSVSYHTLVAQVF